MAVVPYPIVSFAAQDVDDVAGGEALADAVDAAEEFLHQQRAVEADGRVQAVVAVAAGFGVFAEVAQQHDAAAFGGFAYRQHGVEFLQFDAFLEFAALAFEDAFAQDDPVVEAVAQPADGGQAVPSGAAAFLIEVLEVGDEADVGFVYAHAEGDGGDDDEAVFVGEAVLRGFALLHGHAGVVGHGIQAVFA